MESIVDLMKNHFAGVIGKSEVSVFVQSLRKSLGSLIVVSHKGNRRRLCTTVCETVVSTSNLFYKRSQTFHGNGSCAPSLFAEKRPPGVQSSRLRIKQRDDTEILAAPSSAYARKQERDLLTYHLRFPSPFISRRAYLDKNVSQMHYARKGIVTPEMEFVALRERLLQDPAHASLLRQHHVRIRAKLGQSARQINLDIGVGVRAGGVVDRQGKILLGAIRVVSCGKSDLPVGNTQIRMAALTVTFCDAG